MYFTLIKVASAGTGSCLLAPGGSPAPRRRDSTSGSWKTSLNPALYLPCCPSRLHSCGRAAAGRSGPRPARTESVQNQNRLRSQRTQGHCRDRKRDR
ncbi:hypothetical protein SKAU_G00216120 [Synaphobranchus kaupii]|uniref:Uncharacterized protein n=1 Tax=Synaphobranchus kaupii TaxID=118154 RepID=A0A9Q1ITE2_SYNKA|nr:hypothetical protein SKAU_G00216120 [Synaphobranchus kaupii]